MPTLASVMTEAARKVVGKTQSGKIFIALFLLLLPFKSLILEKKFIYGQTGGG